MVMDALRGYVQLASGLTEVSRQRAQQAAKQLLQQTGADSLTAGLSARVSELADEIIATSKSNRALLQAIITNEVEGVVARLGFVRAEEVAALRRRVDKLEQEAGTPAKKATTKKSAAKRSASRSTSKSTAGSTAGSTTKKTAKKA
jgi:polyhydroxyalkanoate synthesis regulator phasin